MHIRKRLNKLESLHPTNTVTPLLLRFDKVDHIEPDKLAAILYIYHGEHKGEYHLNQAELLSYTDLTLQYDIESFLSRLSDPTGNIYFEERLRAY